MIYRPGPFAAILMVFVVIFLLAPLLAVVPISVTSSTYLALPDGDYSLRHYRALLKRPQWIESTLLSFYVGIVSASLATILATMFSVGVWLAQPRFLALLVGFVILPMIVPPVVSAVTLYFLLSTISQFASVIGYDSFGGVVLTHVVMISPFAVILMLVTLSRVDRQIDMAARSCGASVWRRALSVVLPNVRFGVASAAFLSFILSWEEIAVTLFVTSVNAVTLPRLVWSGLRDNVDPAIAALSVLLIVATILLLLAAAIFRRHSAGQS